MARPSAAASGAPPLSSFSVILNRENSSTRRSPEVRYRCSSDSARPPNAMNSSVSASNSTAVSTFSLNVPRSPGGTTKLFALYGSRVASSVTCTTVADVPCVPKSTEITYSYRNADMVPSSATAVHAAACCCTEERGGREKTGSNRSRDDAARYSQGGAQRAQ